MPRSSVLALRRVLMRTYVVYGRTYVKLVGLVAVLYTIRTSVYVWCTYTIHVWCAFIYCSQPLLIATARLSVVRPQCKEADVRRPDRRRLNHACRRPSIVGDRCYARVHQIIRTIRWDQAPRLINRSLSAARLALVQLLLARLMSSSSDPQTRQTAGDGPWPPPRRRRRRR